jgi:hypothetical protein
MVENKEGKPPGETPGNRKKEKSEKKEMRVESRKEFSEGKKAEDKSPKSEQRPTYQKILQEIRELEGKKLFPKNKTEKEEAERQLEKLEKKREEYKHIAQRLGLFREIDKRMNGIREMSSRGKMFFADLNRESRAPFPDPGGIPKELQGLAQEYYQKEVLKIIGEKLMPEKPEEQEKILREYLKVLRTGRLAPELITSNPLWIEMTSMIPYFKPELQKEFKARFEIFRYALGFKTADGVESGISGASRVLMPHISKALKVEEIQKAYDLLEESSQITKEEIIQRDNISDDEAKEKIRKENPLYAGTEEQKKVVLGNLALKLTEAMVKSEELTKGEKEKIKKLNDEQKKEEYMWAVEEADDVWRITFRSDESDIGMEGKGGQWYLNRLFHYAARLKTKGFGYESTRKYFNRPFFPEEIAPSKKGEGRGLMMKGFWEYQIDHLKDKGLEKLGFQKEGDIKLGKDGNGHEMPYVIYKKKFTSPSGEEKEMVVRISVFEKNKYAVKEEDRYGYANVIEIANPSAEILSEICQQVPEGFYGSYVGDWIIKVDNAKKILESGVLKFPPGSDENIRRLLSELQSKKLFDHLDPLSKDRGERKPGKYYQEDAWEDLIRGAVDFGLHEGKKKFEPWKIWGTWRAGVLTKAATDFKVITDEQGREIENEMLPFLGMRGNIPRWLRCNFDRYTMVFRWGPMRMMMLGEMIKRFFQGIFQGPPFGTSK